MADREVTKSELPVREQVASFGPDDSLVGVVAAPPLDGPGEPPPGLLLVNSGIVHRVGIWRMHVRLARTLARSGYPSLRFDLSGVGDSESSRAATDLDALVAGDLEDAVDYCHDVLGFRGVVLAGLCSGARDALEWAVRDPRVRGVVAIDLIAELRTPGYLLARYGPKVVRWASWQRLLLTRGSSGKEPVPTDVLAEDSPPAGEGSPRLGIRNTLTREELEKKIRALLNRDARLLFVYSAGLEFNYLYRGQFHHALPGLSGDSRLRTEFFPEADHTFSAAGHQAELIGSVARWMCASFPPNP
ncbi:MAG: alpha/beta fold hydrolase [Chromatiales bacterium]|nr:alpha/beta fold hydrolase [Chromatiales bacterium]